MLGLATKPVDPTILRARYGSDFTLILTVSSGIIASLTGIAVVVRQLSVAAKNSAEAEKLMAEARKLDAETKWLHRQTPIQRLQGASTAAREGEQEAAQAIVAAMPSGTYLVPTDLERTVQRIAEGKRPGRTSKWARTQAKKVLWAVQILAYYGIELRVEDR